MCYKKKKPPCVYRNEISIYEIKLLLVYKFVKPVRAPDKYMYMKHKLPYNFIYIMLYIITIYSQYDVGLIYYLLQSISNQYPKDNPPPTKKNHKYRPYFVNNFYAFVNTLNCISAWNIYYSVTRSITSIANTLV